MPLTHRGENDLRKPACWRYCKRDGDFCPMVNKGGFSVQRWTDVESDGGSESADYKDSRTTSGDDIEKGASPCSCWGDGSGFEYSIPARSPFYYPIGPAEEIYDLYNYTISHTPMQQKGNSWNAWIEKFQPDYRFGRVSDTNAEMVLFPNIDNPWMFTEYVFQGKGNEEKFIMIEPPLFDPDNLELINGDKTIKEEDIKKDFYEKYHKTDMVTEYDEDEFGDSHVSGYTVKQFRKITNWDDWKTDKEKWVDWNKPEGQREQPISQPEGEYTVKNAGVKLYKANINVQCVKWGEHGNIPPHTLDMTAPADFLNPEAAVSKIRAVTVAHIGSPLFANAYGVLIHKGKEFYIVENVGVSSSTDADGKPIYTYDIPESGGVRQNMPVNKKGFLLTPKDSKDNGTYIHGGCELCVGSGGTIRCQKMSTVDKESPDYEYLVEHFNFDSCKTFGSSHCKFFVPSKEYPAIAYYQKDAQNMAEYYNAMGTYTASSTAQKEAWADHVLNNSTGLPSADMFIAMGVGMTPRTYVRGDTTLPQDVEITYETKFETVSAGKELPQLNGQPKDFGKGLQIIPETGKFALDTRENNNVFGNDEPNCYDDINPLSCHRFFTSVLHCATQANCNEYCGLAHRQGFSPDKRAGGANDCRYFINASDKKARNLHGCPYTSVPKRAYEFSETMQLASSMIISIGNVVTELSQYGFWSKEEPEASNYRNLWECVKEEKVTKYGDLCFVRRNIGDANEDLSNDSSFGDIDLGDDLTLGDEGEEETIDHISVFASEDVSSRYGGIKAKKLSGDGVPSGYSYLVCYLKAKSKKIKLQKYNEDDLKTYSVIANTVTDAYFYYQPLDDDGGTITKSKNNHVDDDGLWLCKADNDFVAPSSNCMMVDNEEKFIGGYHPQYKDFGAMGSEFMQELDAGYEREGHAMGDLTNDSEYSGIKDPPLKKGYWIDASGVYIMDERSTGTEEPIANDDERETASGPAVCISFKKSNTEIDSVSGKKITSKTINGAVFANDSYNVIQTYKKSRKIEDNKIVGRPMFEEPDSDDKYYAPLYCPNPEYLPTMRKALYCPKCDYYISWKYHGQSDTCPWCGTTFKHITGDTGPYDSGETWSEEASVIKKFFKLNAIGQVQVWGPPGTCVHTDAYFWRHQAPITNAIKRQIYHRLGSPNKDKEGNASGGYAMEKMSPESEFTLGYPEGLGYFKKLPNDWNDASTKPYHKSKISWDETVNPTKSGGYNGIAPQNYMPYWDDGSDERVIAPYSKETYGKSNNDNVATLKLNSHEQMRILRNALEPVLAYSSDRPAQNDYPTTRASYEHREEKTQNIIYRNKKAVITPVVLAYTNGGDAYQEYYSGDLSYGNVREYYPPGYTWWWLKQCLGGRYTTWSQGPYHMDGGSGWLPNCVYPKTPRTIAKCAVFIHGIIPLDKEIVAAYCIIGPGGPEPSKDPIGRPWNAGQTMYAHYHAKRKEHFNYGWQKHLHGNAGYPIGVYFDADGKEVDTRPPGTIYFASDDKKVEFQDYSDYRLWGANNQAKESEYVSTIEDTFFDTMTNLSAMMDMSFYTHCGAEKEDIKNKGNVVGKGYKYGVPKLDKDGNKTPVLDIYGNQAYDDNGDPMYELEDNPDLKGLAFKNSFIDDDVTRRKYQYCVVNGKGDIVQVYPDELIWKTTTEERLNTAIARGTSRMEFSVSDGTKENTVSYTFTQTSEELYGKTIPNNSQGITGYFDMGWTNTTGSLYGTGYEVLSGGSSVWEYPVIFQETTNENRTYGGSNVVANLGLTERCMDITGVVTSLYNTRINREFTCKAGNTLSEVMNMPFPVPQANGSLGSVDEDIIAAQSNGGDGSYLLTDTVSYPEIDSSGDIPSIDPDGEKYPLAKAKVKLVCSVLFPIKVQASSSYYSMTKTDEKTKKTKKVDTKYGAKTITNMETLQSVVTTILPGVTFTKRSNTLYEIESSSILEIPSGAKYIYGKLGISSGTHTTKQSRVVSCSSYVPGSHPDTLFSGGGGWVSNAFHPRTQSFVVDLARAPLCISQRDYRARASSVDYSNCKCPDENCSAHTNTCAIAANMLGKKWDNSSPKCPEGHSLEGVDGAISTPGDGIMTYEYAPMFNENPFITQVSITAMEGCSVSVSVKNTKQDEWRSIMPKNSNKETELDIIIDPKDPDSRVRARYIQVVCTPKEETISASFNVVRIENYEIECSGDFSEYEDFSFVGCKIESYDVVSEQVNEEKTSCIFYVNKNLDEEDITFETVTFSLKRYVCGITKFSVNGFHYIDTPTELEYKTNDGTQRLKYLTITDVEDLFYTNIDTHTASYTLGKYPSKIYSVAVGRTGDGGIELEETNDKNNLVWNVESVTIEDKNAHAYVIKKITGGNYFYDPEHNTIILPKKDGDGEKWGNFENAIRGKGLNVSYIPTRLIVRFFSGNGKEITLRAEANGEGPSYQLEKDAIQYISLASQQNMEDCGSTTKMIDASGNEISGKKIDWICSNERPCCLSIEQASKRVQVMNIGTTNSGEFRKPSFMGNEIATNNDDMAFVELFGEAQSRCFGRCITDVTFTGAPNRILSGNIGVIAKAYTKRTIDTGNGSVTYYERTGGLANGCLIVKCPPADAGEGLCTETMGLPTIIIYAKERNPKDPV